MDNDNDSVASSTASTIKIKETKLTELPKSNKTTENSKDQQKIEPTKAVRNPKPVSPNKSKNQLSTISFKAKSLEHSKSYYRITGITLKKLKEPIRSSIKYQPTSARRNNKLLNRENHFSKENEISSRMKRPKLQEKGKINHDVEPKNPKLVAENISEETKTKEKVDSELDLGRKNKPDKNTYIPPKLGGKENENPCDTAQTCVKQKIKKLSFSKTTNENIQPTLEKADPDPKIFTTQATQATCTSEITKQDSRDILKLKLKLKKEVQEAVDLALASFSDNLLKLWNSSQQATPICGKVEDKRICMSTPIGMKYPGPDSTTPDV